MEKIPITKAGEKDLIEKLRQLKTKERPDISQALSLIHISEPTRPY